MLTIVSTLLRFKEFTGFDPVGRDSESTHKTCVLFVEVYMLFTHVYMYM